MLGYWERFWLWLGWWCGFRLLIRALIFLLFRGTLYVRKKVRGGDKMGSINATNARKSLYRLIDEVQESHVPIRITGKKSAAVLVAEEDWRAIEETLFLVSIPGMRDAIKAAMAEPLADSVKEVKW
jgi:antitoxin YefM